MEFRALAAADLPLLQRWLARPHVSEWWQPTPTLAELTDEYLPRLAMDVLPLDAEAGVTQYLVYDDGEAVGYIQAYRVMGRPGEAGHSPDGWWPDETDPGALGIDQFIGLPERLGQGLGTRMVRAFVEWLFLDARVTSVQVDPHPDNQRAIAAYRKVGFREVDVVQTPDGPALLLRLARQRW